MKARLLKSDGTLVKKPVTGRPVISQEVFMEEAMNAERPRAIEEKRSIFKKVRNLFKK